MRRTIELGNLRILKEMQILIENWRQRYSGQLFVNSRIDEGN